LFPLSLFLSFASSCHSFSSEVALCSSIDSLHEFSGVTRDLVPSRNYPSKVRCTGKSSSRRTALTWKSFVCGRVMFCVSSEFEFRHPHENWFPRFRHIKPWSSASKLSVSFQLQNVQSWRYWLPFQLYLQL
jgi:hypothetical protein